jgi:histidyl-tRNA synthetase
VVLRTLQQLREAGVRVQMHARHGRGPGSIKSQMKKADASGAAYALIFGADELARGEVTLKALRDGSGAQLPGRSPKWPPGPPPYNPRLPTPDSAWQPISISKNRNSSTSSSISGTPTAP